MLVVLTTPTLFNICYQLDMSIRWLRTRMAITPLSYATGKYEIIKLLQPYTDCSRDYPVHTFTKLILTGDSGAGKTTIAQLVAILAHRSSSSPAVDCVADVKRFTAGIVPHHVESNLGNFVLYDFAGAYPGF